MRPLFHSVVWRDLTKPGQVIDLWKKGRENQWSHSPTQLYVVTILWGSNYSQSPYFLWAWGTGELICPEHTSKQDPSRPSSSEIYMTLPELIVPEGISISCPLYHHMLVWEVRCYTKCYNTPITMVWKTRLLSPTENEDSSDIFTGLTLARKQYYTSLITCFVLSVLYPISFLLAPDQYIK